MIMKLCDGELLNQYPLYSLYAVDSVNLKYTDDNSKMQFQILVKSGAVIFEFLSVYKANKGDLEDWYEKCIHEYEDVLYAFEKKNFADMTPGNTVLSVLFWEVKVHKAKDAHSPA